MESKLYIDEYGNKYWKNSAGLLHRENDLPAVENILGDVCYYINGRFHRANGPARIFANGRKDWYINGCRIANPRSYSLDKFFKHCEMLNNYGE